jgi:hypothetical protein
MLLLLRVVTNFITSSPFPHSICLTSRTYISGCAPISLRFDIVIPPKCLRAGHWGRQVLRKQPQPTDGAETREPMQPLAYLPCTQTPLYFPLYFPRCGDDARTRWVKRGPCGFRCIMPDFTAARILPSGSRCQRGSLPEFERSRLRGQRSRHPCEIPSFR